MKERENKDFKINYILNFRLLYKILKKYREYINIIMGTE